MKSRITIDLTNEPEVFERLVNDARRAQRKLAAQLKFECLPTLRAATKPKSARAQTNINHA